MKTVIKIIIGIMLTGGLTFFYLIRFTYSKSGENYLLYLHPFQPDQNYFENNFKNAEQKLNEGDSISAKKHFNKALKYRGTYNERQRENIYSDANEYWEYKLDKLLKYSKAYECTGSLDSAISSLAPGLTSFEKWHYPIDKRFYELVIKRDGKIATIKTLDKGLNKIQKLDCYHCCSYYYWFGNFKIGVEETEYEQAKNDKSGLLKKLCKIYEI